MRPFAGALFAAILVVSAADGIDAQSQVVRVTVPKANVRSEPSDKAPILLQAAPNDHIEWLATEGDWFKVLMPPNPALGGARVEAYISKKVSKMVAEVPSAPAKASADASAEKSSASAIDTHAANVFLGSIVDGTLLRQLGVTVVHTQANRDAWTIENQGDWSVVSDRRPSFVVSIGDGAGFSVMGMAPSVVRLASAAIGTTGLVIGSAKGDKDWKSDEVSTEMTEGPAGVWSLKPSKDLKPADYAIVLRPTSSKAAAPAIAWAFTVK